MINIMNKILISILIICVLFSIVSCGSYSEDDGVTFTETINDAETTGAMNESETTENMNEIEIVPLTTEELEPYNEAFEYKLFDEQGNAFDTQGNPVSVSSLLNDFLTSYYSQPEDINLTNLLQHFPSDGQVTDETEFQALKAAEHFPFVDVENLESMFVPIHRIPADSVNEALKKYMGITLDDLNGVGTDDLVYLEAYDAYYNYTSDCGDAFFECVSGEKQGDIVRLYSKGATLTLKLRDDGFWFVSYLPINELSGEDER